MYMIRLTEGRYANHDLDEVPCEYLKWYILANQNLSPILELHIKRRLGRKLSHAESVFIGDQ